MLDNARIEQAGYYEDADFKGKSLEIMDSILDLKKLGFNRTVSSIYVEKGIWTVFENVHFQGRSYILNEGKYNIDQISANLGSGTVSSIQLLTFPEGDLNF